MSFLLLNGQGTRARRIKERAANVDYLAFRNDFRIRLTPCQLATANLLLFQYWICGSRRMRYAYIGLTKDEAAVVCLSIVNAMQPSSWKLCCSGETPQFSAQEL